jgi:hypothetical protein
VGTMRKEREREKMLGASGERGGGVRSRKAGMDDFRFQGRLIVEC